LYHFGIKWYYGGDIMTNKVQINLRLQPEIIEKLKAEAEKQKRSVNNLLEVIIDEFLKEQDN
jgi:hypothetical protein